MSEYERREYIVVYECDGDTMFDMGTKERIVRCRDCTHYKPYRTHRHGTMNRCYDENGNTHRRDECDFCSRGVRREP